VFEKKNLGLRVPLAKRKGASTLLLLTSWVSQSAAAYTYENLLFFYGAASIGTSANLLGPS